MMAILTLETMRLPSRRRLDRHAAGSKKPQGTRTRAPHSSLFPAIRPDLASYDHILVAFSGGKDSLNCLVHLLDEAVDPARRELHHQNVEGRGPPTFDWAVIASYCRMVAETFGVPLYFSWRDAGLRREMLRHGEPTAPVMFETPEGQIATIDGHGKPGTRVRSRKSLRIITFRTIATSATVSAEPLRDATPGSCAAF